MMQRKAAASMFRAAQTDDAEPTARHRPRRRAEIYSMYLLCRTTRREQHMEKTT